MSTNSTLGYVDEWNEFHGTYIHWDGNTVGRMAGKALEAEGYDALVQWIDAGIESIGYSAFDMDANPNEDTNNTGGKAITFGEYVDTYALEFGWVVTPNGVQAVETYLYEQKRLKLAYNDCLIEAEELVPDTGDFYADFDRVLVLVEKIARERFGSGSETHSYIDNYIEDMAG